MQLSYRELERERIWFNYRVCLFLRLCAGISIDVVCNSRLKMRLKEHDRREQKRMTLEHWAASLSKWEEWNRMTVTQANAGLIIGSSDDMGWFSPEITDIRTDVMLIATAFQEASHTISLIGHKNQAAMSKSWMRHCDEVSNSENLYTGEDDDKNESETSEISKRSSCWQEVRKWKAKWSQESGCQWVPIYGLL